MAPARILPRQPHHDVPYLSRRGWASAPGGRLPPFPAHECAMPPQQRSRGDQTRFARRAWQVAGRRREQGTISGAKLRPRDLAAQNIELVAQDQQLDVLDVQATRTPNQRAEQSPERHVEEGEGHGRRSSPFSRKRGRDTNTGALQASSTGETVMGSPPNRTTDRARCSTSARAPRERNGITPAPDELQAPGAARPTTVSLLHWRKGSSAACASSSMRLGGGRGRLAAIAASPRSGSAAAGGPARRCANPRRPSQWPSEATGGAAEVLRRPDIPGGAMPALRPHTRQHSRRSREHRACRAGG